MIRNSSSKELVFSRLDAVMLIAARHAEGVCFVMVGLLLLGRLIFLHHRIIDRASRE